MTFDFDPASIVQDSYSALAFSGERAAGFDPASALARPDPAQAAPLTLEEALAQGALPACGCASRAAITAAILAPTAAEILAPGLADTEPDYARLQDAFAGAGGAAASHRAVIEAPAPPAAEHPAALTAEPAAAPTKLVRASFDDVDGDGVEDGPIYVTATADSYFVGFGGAGTIGSGGLSGGGGGGLVQEPKDTPCVEAAPEGVPLVEINRAALAASNAIARLDQRYEYGVLIYEKDGVVGWTTPFTQFREGTIGYSISGVPAGARILAMLHNHPDQNLVNDAIPSYGGDLHDDWQAFQGLIDSSGVGGIAVDSNLLM